MRVSLFGYGLTTKALAQKIQNVTFYDDNCHKPFKDEHGFRIHPSSDFRPEYSDLEIPSPSFNPNHSLIAQAKNLVSEYDYFAKQMPFSIWVSGTNGKTTTTQMIEHLLKCKGAISGGNIGTPLASLDNRANIWVLETSSYTFHYTHLAKPNIYVLLDITPDHLSWHGSFEAYEAAKLKPLSQMQEGEMIILPKKYAHIQSNAFCVYYECAEDLADFFTIDISRVNYKGGFLIDALLALAVERTLYDSVSYDKINNFTMDKNRQEPIRDKHNRLWINDSKATNVEATLACLEAYKEKPIHLILGGDDKGASLIPLFKTLQNMDATVYAIGANANKIVLLCEEYKIVCQLTTSLELSVQSIAQNLLSNEIAILSPAAASFDQFSSYIERGEKFKEFVANLS